MSREVPTTILPDTLEALDAWDVELVFDARPERMQPLATIAPAAVAVAPTPAPETTAAPAPQNLVQVAVLPTIYQTPAPCVRLWAATLIGLGTLLAASAFFGR